jgi:transcriptional regulator with XRE-family HTH domain
VTDPAEQLGIREATAPSSYAELADVLANLGLIVREARRARRLSLRAASESIGHVDFTTLSRIESGQQGTRVSHAVALLRWLGGSAVVLEQDGTDVGAALAAAVLSDREGTPNE